MLFKDFQLNPMIQKALQDQHYKIATPIQQKAIPLLLEGKDLLGCAQTGTGKTAAFALPILEKLIEIKNIPDKKTPIRALVLAPTRELALQIGESFQKYGKYLDVRIAVIFGGVTPKHQIKAMKRDPNIIVATPGRLVDLVEQGYIDLSHIDMLVLDEADRMLDLGMSKDVKKIVSLLPEKRQNMLFSATMPKEVTSLVNNILKNAVKVEVSISSKEKSDINESVYFVNEPHKTSLLLKLLEDELIESVLIFTKTKGRANKVSKVINNANIRTKAIHGGKKQQTRKDALEMFKTKKIRILIATDIAARGLDINDITHVINMDLPQVPETYIHRIGRTGRAGKTGVAISFCSVQEVEFLQAIEKEIGHQITEVENHEFLPLHMVLIRGRDEKV
jgi:ATP-dependent RNA helicase RhlE